MSHLPKHTEKAESNKYLSRAREAVSGLLIGYGRMGTAVLTSVMLAPGCSADIRGFSSLIDEQVMLDGGCSGNYDSPDISGYISERTALQCRENMLGSVALVTYGMAKSASDTLAADAEEIIPYIFEDKLAPKIVSVPISEQVARRFAELNPQGCFDKDDPDRYLSKVADEMMELSDYKKIIGVSPLKECDKDEQIGGVNHISEGGRYGMVVSPFDYESDPRMGPYTSTATILSHEYGHAVGLGHSGKFGGKDYSFANYFDMQTRTLDIGKIIANEAYQEYGNDGNIMGTGVGFLDAIQYRRLRLPGIVMGSETDPRKIIGTEPISFTRENTETDTLYAAIDLKEIIVLTATDSVDKDDTAREFDQLVVEPVFYQVGDTYSGGVKFYLANSKNAMTAKIGYVSQPPNVQDVTYKFVVGEREIKVDISDAGIAIRYISDEE